MTVEQEWRAPGIPSLTGVWRLRDYGDHIDDLKRGRIVVIGDVEADPRTVSSAAQMSRHAARAIVNVPVRMQPGSISLLFVNQSMTRHWSDEDIALVREVAARTQTAMERLAAEAGLRGER